MTNSLDLGLDLDLGSGLRGRRAKPLHIEVERELTSEDMEALMTTERGSSAPTLSKLRDRHHALAKAIASGMSEGEAALMHGYSSSRVSILKSDPAFAELVAFYRRDVEEEYFGLHERLAGIAIDAATELTDRLEESPDDFSIGQLVELTKMGADRTGHGPSSKQQVDVRVGIADRMDAAKARLKKLNDSRDIIDVTPEPSDD